MDMTDREVYWDKSGGGKNLLTNFYRKESRTDGVGDKLCADLRLHYSNPR